MKEQGVRSLDERASLDAALKGTDAVFAMNTSYEGGTAEEAGETAR